MKEKTFLVLKQLYYHSCGNEAIQIQKLPQSGSYREYYRMTNADFSAIGVHSEDKVENEAFLSMCKTFYQHGFNVPEIYDTQLSDNVYLLEDLGNTTLYDFVKKQEKRDPSNEELKKLYERTIIDLSRFQIDMKEKIDYSFCYPRAAFDEQSMQWDLNYFKYNFLKLARIPFDEQKLENDFKTLMAYLLKVPGDYFMYRDFQSSNIMLRENGLFYIDFQGGRKGPLPYDLASLLYDAKAELSNDLRDHLLEYYCEILSGKINQGYDQFKDSFGYFVLLRMMQAFGAYGFRGLHEKKARFIESIPGALDNLNHVLNHYTFHLKLPELRNVFDSMINNSFLKSTSYRVEKLTVRINSFSYKMGIPTDYSGNGGGFTFDCRGLTNPGRIEQYKMLTGKDQQVREFLQQQPEVNQFMENVTRLVDLTVENYLRRDFKHLTVNFGCTGGQHRSVYAAESLCTHLKQKFDIEVILNHREIDKE